MGEASDPTAFKIWICPTCGKLWKAAPPGDTSGCCVYEHEYDITSHALESDDGDHSEDWKNP